MKVRHLQTGKVYHSKLYQEDEDLPECGTMISIITFDGNWQVVEILDKYSAKLSYKLVEASPEELEGLRKEGYTGPGWTLKTQ